MNRVTLIGRLVRDPVVRYTQGQEQTCFARYTLAVDRRVKKDQGQQTADFISCVAFGRAGEFVEKYLRQGIKIAVEGRIQTGSYTNKDGQKVYTTNVVVEQHEFVEKKNANETTNEPSGTPDEDGFMHIPDGVDDEGLPFN